jgi:sulfonate transport system permease protein
MRRLLVWLKENILAIVLPVIVLLAWEEAGRQGIVRATFLPRPSVLTELLWEMLVSGELLRNLGTSILRVAEGFLIGATLGTIVGIQVALIKKLRTAVSLIFGILRPIPVMA